MDQNQQKPQEIFPMAKIESMGNVLEKIADLPGGGRAKCGLIWVMGDLLEQLSNDILIMQEQLNNYYTSNQTPEVNDHAEISSTDDEKKAD